jgi:hypothetical protein
MVHQDRNRAYVGDRELGRRETGPPCQLSDHRRQPGRGPGFHRLGPNGLLAGGNELIKKDSVKRCAQLPAQSNPWMDSDRPGDSFDTERPIPIEAYALGVIDQYTGMPGEKLIGVIGLPELARCQGCESRKRRR